MQKKLTGNRAERVVKDGKRYYRKADRKAVPFYPLFNVLTRTTSALVAKSGDDSPSVTTILGVLDKPALIGWAAKKEREMIIALAGKTYEELNKISAEPVSKDRFMSILAEEAGQPANRRLLVEAANVGTQVHNRIEWEFKGELGKEREADAPVLGSAQAIRAFERWQEWRAQVKLKPLEMERGLYSSVFGFGGTLDLLAEVTPEPTIGMMERNPYDPGTPEAKKFNEADDARLAELTKTRVVVLDFKTGKHIYEEAFLQNIAYRMALAEEGISTDGGIIVRLPKYEDDPVFDTKDVPQDEMLAPVFICLRLVYQWVAAHKPKYVKKPKTPLEGVDTTVENVVESERKA